MVNGLDYSAIGLLYQNFIRSLRDLPKIKTYLARQRQCLDNCPFFLYNILMK